MKNTKEWKNINEWEKKNVLNYKCAQAINGAKQTKADETTF